MSEVDALREYAKFRAAGSVLSDVGSATDIRSIDVAAAADIGRTDPYVAWRVFGEQRWPYREVSRTVENASSTGGPDIVILVPEQGEASFFANLGDFAALDDSRTPEGQIRRQIRSLRAGSLLIYGERLARRLEFLLEAMEEEGEAWSEDSPESLRTMLLFLQSVPNFRYPTVTITPSATFRAQWTADPNAHLAVDFLPNGQVRFVVFCPDPRHSDRIRRVSGITSWENVINTVEPYKVHHWAADARA